MISVYIMSEAMVSGQNFKDSMVISIVSPGRVHPPMEGTNIFKFQFHDIAEEYFLEGQNKIIRPMQKEIAESIVEIAMNNRECDRWIIHCEAGISRSPGVAIGLARYISTKPGVKRLKELYPAYNKYVASLVEWALLVKINEVTKGLDAQAGCGHGGL